METAGFFGGESDVELVRVVRIGVLGVLGVLGGVGLLWGMVYGVTIC